MHIQRKHIYQKKTLNQKVQANQRKSQNHRKISTYRNTVACNMLRPTMLRSVAFKCCDRLAGALTCTGSGKSMLILVFVTKDIFNKSSAVLELHFL